MPKILAIRHPASTRPPRGWRSRAQILAEACIAERTFADWRSMGLIPRPFITTRRGKPDPYYRPETFTIVRRIKELREKNRSADAWLWQLWLEGHSVEMKDWAGRRIKEMTKALVAEKEHAVSMAPAVVALSAGRLRNPDVARSIAEWALSVAAGNPDAIDDAAANNDANGTAIFDALRKIGGLPVSSAYPMPEAALFEMLSVARQDAIIAEATDEEMEQARRDCQAIERLIAAARNVDWSAAMPAIEPAIDRVTGARPDPPSWQARKAKRLRARQPPAVIGFYLNLWQNLDFRAMTLAFLIGARRDPDRSKRITEILALSDWALSMFPRQDGRNHAQ